MDVNEKNQTLICVFLMWMFHIVGMRSVPLSIQRKNTQINRCCCLFDVFFLWKRCNSAWNEDNFRVHCIILILYLLFHPQLISNSSSYFPFSSFKFVVLLSHFSSFFLLNDYFEWLNIFSFILFFCFFKLIQLIVKKVFVCYGIYRFSVIFVYDL